MTDQYAVIGNPIGHTKSPLIHGLFAEGTHQAMSYVAIEGPLEPDDAFAKVVHQFELMPRPPAERAAQA